MGVFGQFVYGDGPDGDVYGPYEAIGADMLGEDVVVLTLNNTVVVNDNFRDVNNYSISIVEGTGAISVRAVIIPKNKLTTNQIILEVDRPTKGTTYEVSINNLDTTDGLGVTGSAAFIGRRTKLESMLKSLAQHWDKRPNSVIRNFLAAISIEDDRIGGSRLDDL